ncbi:serine/arginine repetitive matrix protein 1-like [Equus quagga]|uniref:serine/arginine repetitive matrix protein 1-like n=1 Tax=Equus quagga TaxID=89248 RepID=UPI001EE24C0D|nr:serine/arginine repetitive matrix protein 1-like [Equus quagga]
MVVAAIQGFARRGLMGRLSASCSQEEVSGLVDAVRLTKSCPFVLKPKVRPPLRPALPGRAFVARAQPPPESRSLLPHFRTEPGASRNRSVAGRVDTFSPYASPRKKPASFTRSGHPSHLHPSPQSAFPGGGRSPRAPPASRVGGPGRSSATRSGSLGQVLERQFPGPRSGNQGAPGLGAAKTRRGRARDSQARYPLAATGSATIHCRAEVWPAQQRAAWTRQGDQGRDARAPHDTGIGAHGGQSRGEAPGPAPADPCASRLRLRPWPLPLARVGSSTPLFGSERTKTSSVRRGPAAAINHHAGPPSRSSRAGARGRLRVPGRTGRPALPVSAWGTRDCAGNLASSFPVRQRQGPASPTRCHHHASLRSPDPEATRASPDRCLGVSVCLHPGGERDAAPSTCTHALADLLQPRGV